MGSIRVLPTKGTLFMDFRLNGKRVREYTALPDTPANRKRLQKALDRIETEIALGSFDYAKTFGKPLPAPAQTTEPDGQTSAPEGPVLQPRRMSGTPLFRDFAETWFTENEVQWRRSYRITQRGALNKYLIPYFGDKEMGQISKADVLAFRAELAKAPARQPSSTLSNRRVNSVMKPLRQILNEAADRFEFTSAFRNIRPLKMKRSDVQPFTLDEVQLILSRAREDYRPYFTFRFFTGMRSGEVHGLKWKYIDFERRLILVRESIVLGEEDELKTEGSQRDIQMTQLVYEALLEQFNRTGKLSEYVFCNQAGKALDNKNFVNRVWAPLLRHLGLAHRKAYQMRHTAATLWLAAGEAPEWIARQLGHTSTEMLFRVYSRFVPNLTRQDGSAFDRLLTRSFANRMPQIAANPIALPAPDRLTSEDAPQADAQPPPGLMRLAGIAVQQDRLSPQPH
jgi:integrase